MTMTRFKLSICSLGFALIFVPWAIPQDVVISRSTTVKEKLKQYNIGVSKEALVQALHNPNAEIRNLAAQQLAGEGDRDAIPEIIKALDAEKALPIRNNIAFALAWLGEKKGGITLKDACNESSVPGYLRARAALVRRLSRAAVCHAASHFRLHIVHKLQCSCLETWKIINSRSCINRKRQLINAIIINNITS